jgi:hypothetical protein
MKYLYGPSEKIKHERFLRFMGCTAPKVSWRQTTPAPSGNKHKGGK